MRCKRAEVAGASPACRNQRIAWLSALLLALVFVLPAQAYASGPGSSGVAVDGVAKQVTAPVAPVLTQVIQPTTPAAPATPVTPVLTQTTPAAPATPVLTQVTAPVAPVLTQVTTPIAPVLTQVTAPIAPVTTPIAAAATPAAPITSVIAPTVSGVRQETTPVIALVSTTPVIALVSTTVVPLAPAASRTIAPLVASSVWAPRSTDASAPNASSPSAFGGPQRVASTHQPLPAAAFSPAAPQLMNAPSSSAGVGSGSGGSGVGPGALLFFFILASVFGCWRLLVGSDLVPPAPFVLLAELPG